MKILTGGRRFWLHRTLLTTYFLFLTSLGSRHQFQSPPSAISDTRLPFQTCGDLDPFQKTSIHFKRPRSISEDQPPFQKHRASISEAITEVSAEMGITWRTCGKWNSPRGRFAEGLALRARPFWRNGRSARSISLTNVG